MTSQLKKFSREAVDNRIGKFQIKNVNNPAIITLQSTANVFTFAAALSADSQKSIRSVYSLKKISAAKNSPSNAALSLMEMAALARVLIRKRFLRNDASGIVRAL